MASGSERLMTALAAQALAETLLDEKERKILNNGNKILAAKPDTDVDLTEIEAKAPGFLNVLWKVLDQEEQLYFLMKDQKKG